MNMVGLATGFASCLLILIYVDDELSYDSYNVNAERICRVNHEIKFGGNHAEVAQTPALMGPQAVIEIPQVEQYTRLRWHNNILVRKGNTNLRENRVCSADSTLFQVFTLPMIAGDPGTALKEPHTLVITETMARKYFNRTEVLGQQMTINDKDLYRITGIIRDMPKNSHFNFDIIIPFAESNRSRSDDWLSENFNTYLLLKKGAQIKEVEKRLNTMQDRFAAPEVKSFFGIGMEEFKKQGSFVKCSLTPLRSIHLHSNRIGELEPNGSIQYIYIFSLVAIFILSIACINFMNLFTARSFNRAKEVGLRKILGSRRKELITQFITESLVISILSLLLALLIIWPLLPYCNRLAGKNMEFQLLFRPGMFAGIFMFAGVVGVLAGAYPAFLLSAFQPIEVLKGRWTKGFKGGWLRNVLVVFQFVITITLIIGTMVIHRQLRYMRNKDLGFDRQQVLVIQNTSALRTRAAAFKNEIAKNSAVTGITMTGFLPVEGDRNMDAFFTAPALDQKSAISIQSWTVDEAYLPTLDIQLIAGRNFSPQFPLDSTGVIINEAAAKFLGTKELLNKKIYRVSDITQKTLAEYHIIGIIRNFNFSSLRDEVAPLALFLGRETGSMAIKLKGPDLPALIGQVKEKWQSMAPGQPFSYSFMDEQFNHLYDTEQRTGGIFFTFAILAILIACLGLFGIITYAAGQRVREIGIRKVLGASVIQVVTLLSVDLLRLVVLAGLIAFPLAAWAMHKWLQNFAYRIGIGWETFVFAGATALCIALITVSSRAIGAAMANPVDSLRSE